MEREPQASHLLQETQRRGLHLITPKGEATFKRGTRESVIDLTFVTEGIKRRVIRCKPRDNWAINLDHIPIEIQLSIQLTPKPPSKRYAVKKLDKEAFIKHIKESHWHQDPDPLSKLQGVIKEGLERHCPRSKPSKKANHKWSPRAKELLRDIRQKRKSYLRSPAVHLK